MHTAVASAVILAAGLGRRLGALGTERPKGFVEVGGTTLIERSIRALRAAGIRQIAFGTGHLRQAYEELARAMDGVCVANERYAQTGSLATLVGMKDVVEGDFLLLESDLLYDPTGLVRLLDEPYADVILASGFTRSGDEVYVETDAERNLVALSKDPSRLRSVQAEFVGITKLSLATFGTLVELAETLLADRPTADYEEGLVAVARSHPVRVLKIEDYVWCEVDDDSHLRRAIEVIGPILGG